MKKNRNAFFNENTYMYQNSMMGYPNMNMPNQNINMNMPNPYDDYDQRLAKIERQLNRLDKRISRLESNTISTDDIDKNSNNMYMI